ncbi:pyruvate dehydrogenase complex dihydrolipoyllysine-residue acetyltransferase [Oceanisphaera pacifica]|uniref:Acetyltransferase component of pyruvate dehydrogenase complex n=1 Tax=Oceanisphaera pacifica TaxID=2818389 RepID=A0ABS3NC23_9GAMM|nr:pyruvate dehydrogenase complex dihydrolipoyllysine-residue acetyltransferase [Oceanisphaera pacifica]MBO1518143.1 pyruvate dehydrogenase complex dihydrolipoyllysine-residue acetyltransferase [Oceanisphaera pacifica]
MSKDILVPDIGADEVEVTEIMVAIGDRVEEEQSLLTVEGDKASMEIPAPSAGVVKEIKVAVGDGINTGSLIMVFEAEEGGAAAPAEQEQAPAAKAESAAPASASRQEIAVPDIGDDDVEVTEINVAVGDVVEEEQTLIGVEGDKASMEIPSPAAGKIVEILVAVGDTVKTGSQIMVFEVAGESAASAPAESAPTATPVAPAAAQAKDVNVPDIGGDEVEVTEVMVAVGDTVEAEQSILNVEGDKAAMEVPAPFAGVVKEIKIAVGDKVNTGSLVMVFEVTEAAPAPKAQAPAAEPAPAKAEAPKAQAAPAAPAAQSEFVENNAYVHATPVVRRLAREFGVDLSKVAATGPKSRILKEDVQGYVKGIIKQVAGQPAGVAVAGGGMSVLAWPKVDFAKFGEVEEVAMTRIQKISGPNLHRNWVKIPHVTQFDETDITELEAFRKSENAIAEKQKLGYKISPLIFIMKAVAKTLEAYPKFCSSLSDDEQSLIMKKYIHIGVAVDTPNGLVVPVVRDVNKKGIRDLAIELGEISKKAREGKLKGADMQGGCFTISSLGGIGGTQFTPIVNAPEVAILGVSKSGIKPVWNGKEFEPRLIQPLALSYDHRVIDGADGARFITTLSGVLNDLRRLAL